MESNADFALAKVIAEKLNGKFWEVVPGDWWVTIEGVSRQRLVIWTNDPFGISFTPKELSLSLSHVKQKIMDCLVAENIVLEDGSWRYQASA